MPNHVVSRLNSGVPFQGRVNISFHILFLLPSFSSLHAVLVRKTVMSKSSLYRQQKNQIVFVDLQREAGALFFMEQPSQERVESGGGVSYSSILFLQEAPRASHCGG
jgi:hypothetical protein